MIRTGIIWSGVLIAVMVAMGVYGQMTIPAGTEIAVHWNVSGEPDRFADSSLALWFVPGLALLVSGVLAVVPLIEPRRKHLLESGGLYVRTWVGSMMVVTLAQGIMVMSGVGMELPVAEIILAAVGLLLALIGNVLGKSQSNFFVGIRTPWTLSSDASWDKTHRLAGRLWVSGGLATAVLAFVIEPPYGVWVIIGLILFMVAVPLAASFFYWKADPGRRSNDA